MYIIIIIFSETALPIKAKFSYEALSSLKPIGQPKPNFRMEPSWNVRKKVYINGTGHMTKMVAMLIYAKSLQKSSAELTVL